jgi:ribonuclease R
MLVLRSMNQAIYTPEHRPHFGLNYAGYAHFTSPIRRLADLVNHQLVKSQLRNKAKNAPSELKPDVEALMTELGERASMTERRADAAVYEVLEWLKCEYLKQFLGDTFEGVITTAVKFGLFVTLEPMMAEGLIHIGSLKQDHFKFDAELGALVGTRSHQVLRMGDRVVVQLESVDSSLGQVSLALSEHAPLTRKGQSSGRRTSATRDKKAKKPADQKPKKRGKRER